MIINSHTDEFKDFPSILEQINNGYSCNSPSIKQYENPTNNELSDKEISILDNFYFIISFCYFTNN